MEMEPHNCLFDLLKNYKEICEALENNETSKLNSANVLSTLNNKVWEIEHQTLIQRVLYLFKKYFLCGQNNF